jgi:hypothetical protein
VTRAEVDTSGFRSRFEYMMLAPVTDRLSPRFATAAMHTTRVSGMRPLASRTDAVRSLRASIGPVTTPIQRRGPGSPFGISG